MKTTLVTLVAVATLSLMGCEKKPTAAEVCGKLQTAGVAANCHASTPKMMTAQAAELVEFDLPSVPGKTGNVMRFDGGEKYDATVAAFEKAAPLAGPHRYGSKRALVFVQLNSGLSAAEGANAKAVVDAL